MTFEPRTYRDWIKETDLVSFSVTVRETDLFIRAVENLSAEANESVLRFRGEIEKYIANHSGFLKALKPVRVDRNAPEIIRAMAEAAEKAGVGPMAAVAGAVAEFVGKDLESRSPEIIVENGGDIYLRSLRKRRIGVFAGESPLTGKLAVEIEPGQTPVGVCTSSGTVGHSLSLGKSDAAIVIAPSTPLADAAATALGNRIKTADDIPAALEFAQEMGELSGVILIKGDKIGLWGDANLVPTGKA